MPDQRAKRKPLRFSARLRLTLSYAVFLVAAGSATLVGVYLVLRYVPNYPLVPANPGELRRGYAGSRGEVLNAIVGVSGIILGSLAVVGLTGGWILASWVLRPLQQINRAAEIAASGRLDHRIRLNGRNDEFRDVADSFNHMLIRLQDAFTAQQRFAANASHELRTPLAVTETLLDVARADPAGQDYEQLLERLAVTNTRAIDLTTALLRLADSNAITASSRPVDLATIVDDALDYCAAEADERGISLTARLNNARLDGDATLLGQLATNLVQNAIRHNRLPGMAAVSTHHDHDQQTVMLRVQNTGEVISPDLALQLTEPFLRGGGRVRRPGQVRGYGLGLALVSRIVEVHRGTLSIVPRSGGGLDITVTLPDRVIQPARPRKVIRPTKLREPAFAYRTATHHLGESDSAI